VHPALRSKRKRFTRRNRAIHSRRATRSHRRSGSSDRMNNPLPFIVPTQRERRKADCPNPVIDLFEGDVFADEGTADKQWPPVPGDTTNRRHAPHLAVAGIQVADRRSTGPGGGRRIAPGGHSQEFLRAPARMALPQRPTDQPARNRWSRDCDAAAATDRADPAGRWRQSGRPICSLDLRLERSRRQSVSNLQSPICNLQSAICNLKSTMSRSPPDAGRSPPRCPYAGCSHGRPS
jgi:hypothetical protein